jgi:hypothetical protein
VPDDNDAAAGSGGNTYPPPFVDGLTFDHAELPVASQPLMDLSIFDDVPLDDDGVPVLPADFDRSLLPGFDADGTDDPSVAAATTRKCR